MPRPEHGPDHDTNDERRWEQVSRLTTTLADLVEDEVVPAVAERDGDAAAMWAARAARLARQISELLRQLGHDAPLEVTHAA